MNCDMCGKESNLSRVLVEGTEMSVCNDCKKYGKYLGPVKEPKKEEIKKENEMTEDIEEKEDIEIVVSDFAKKIRSARNKKNMKQEEFAKMISEKESMIHKLETGDFKPSLELARKLEKKLNIKLIETYHEEFKPNKKENSGPLTIGDLIKIKKAK